MKTKISQSLIFLLLTFIFSCEKPERNNPWDEKANIDPLSWAPQNLQIEDVSITEKKLTWTYDDKNIEGFKLDRKKGDESWQVAYQIFPKETRSWNDAEIIPDPDLTYSYRIYAYAGSHNSAEQFVSTSGVIAAPNNLQISKNLITFVTLTWQDNSTGADGFKVERKYEGGDWIQLTAITTNSYEDDDFDLNTQVYYRVCSYVGSYNSSWVVNDFNATIPSPTDLQITNSTITSVTLNWQFNSTGEDGFKIERKYEGGSWEQLTTVTANNYEDTDFDLNTQVYYRVCAYVGTYNSSWVENDFDATIPPPENLDITANSVTTVTLSWDYSHSGHEGFKIDRQVNEGAWEGEFETLNAGQTSFSDNGLDLNNNIYSYRIYAFYNQYQSTKTENLITLKCGYPLIDTRDGNEYETLEIGNQCWIKENLAYLPSVSPPSNGSETNPYYYVYDYQGTNVSEAKATSKYQTYGVLYNWPASLDACPTGWHLSTDDEWTVLIDYLGGESVAGGKMKEIGTIHWDSPNTGATNSSGFTALPGGRRYSNGFLTYLGYIGDWWSSSVHSGYPLYRSLNSTSGRSYRDYDSKAYGFSVRCLKDN